ncbi:MFS transporter, ACS family, hexuronate transporter [Bryocella elongata]|uniref:MFS transporter, ACS family, hexuronate transporter n=1 Tax=Bryocella elongata TaxID=863522 RepID=A0A1H5TDQ4_9BACT|nr:MFS transporter [Bryocella elongata]SEF60147.1 MFS transporter, ACS family, hexuronate transporter [Bryocella elongata]
MTKRSIRPWIIVVLMFVVALLNYFDRQSLSVVAPRMQAALHLTDRQYGHIISLFLMASAFAYALSGFIVDRLGVRASMTLFVGVWSLAESCTAFVHSMFTLGIARFLLGLGEPGLWVAAPKAVVETIETRRQSLAVGLYTLGATCGAVIAVPTIMLITTHYPWRSIFLVDGIAGLLWLPLWWLIYRPRFPSTTRQQRQPTAGASLLALLSQPALWKFMIARGMTDPVWYFYLFWFPKFLLTARRLDSTGISHYGWIVYLGGGLGTIGGGLLSGYLIRRGLLPGRAYRASMMMSAACVIISPLAYFSPSIGGTVLVGSIIACAHMGWLVNLSAALLRVFPPDTVGKAFGLVAAGSAFGGMLSSELIGYFVTHGGYAPAFWLMSCMHPIALALLWNAYEQPNTRIDGPLASEVPA